MTRVPKNKEIKARVDGRTKRELEEMAYRRDLQVSDLLREAVRDLLTSQRKSDTPTESRGLI